MDTKKLAKVIKVIVEHEVKKQLPKLVKEGVTKALNEHVRNQQSQQKQPIEKDPFELANSVLEESRASTSPVEQSVKKRYSSNPVLNDILNDTKPFRDRGTPVQYGESNATNEDFNSMNKTLSFDSNVAAGGLDTLNSTMASKLGYGNMSAPNNPNGGGLGVKTGLPGLDRILNRDNTDLVRKFKTR